MKHLGQYCNQLRKPGGKKNEKDATAIVVGERAHSRRRCRRCHQSQAQVHTQALYNHSQNPLYFVSPPPYVVHSHMFNSILIHNGAHQLLRVTL